MASTPEVGTERLLERVKPRWDRERHERVFAAIVEQIRREEGRRADKATAERRMRLSHAAT